MRKKRNKRWFILLALFTGMVCLFVFLSNYAESRREAALALIKTPESVERFLKRTAAINAEPGSEARAAADITDAEIMALHTRFDDFSALIAHYEATLEKDPEWENVRMILREDSATWTEERWEWIGGFLETYEELLDEIRRIAAGEGPLTEAKVIAGQVIISPKLVAFRSFAQLLGLEALHQGRAGNLDRGVENIIAQSKLGSALSSTPSSTTHMMDFAMQQIAMNTIRDAIPAGALNEEQSNDLLACFREGWKGRNTIADALTMEIRPMLTIVEGLRSGAPIFQEGLLLRLYSTSLARPVLNLDAATYAEWMSGMIDVARLPYYEAAEGLADLQSQIEDLPFYKPLTHMWTPNSARTLANMALHEANMALLRMGLSLERHHVTHGVYPETLDAIAESLGGALVDPFSGEAYHYVPSGDTFLLYSVGENLTDDGGRHNRDDGDLVWRGREADE